MDRYLQFLYNRKKLAHNTKVGYNVTVNTLKQYKLGYMEIGKIKPEHCEDWLVDMKKKYRGSSIQTQISLIKRVFEYAIDRDYVIKIHSAELQRIEAIVKTWKQSLLRI